MNTSEKMLLVLSFCACAVCIIILFTSVLISTIGNNTTPVENDSIITSATKANDSLKLIVNNLDSIKNAKVIEVRSLDNDSTIKLFYQLVAE